MERKVVGAVEVDRARGHVAGRRRTPKLTLKERNPSKTPTGSCASDETVIKTLSGLSDPVDEDQSAAVPHLHPRYKQMQDTWPFEGIITERASDRLKDQTRLPTSCWDGGIQES